MRTSHDTETVRGEVAEVRALKDSWGRLRLRAGSGEAASTVVMGTVLGIDVGTTVECRGRWDTHPQYGAQFKAASIVTVVPSDASGAIAWLASRLPAVGRKRATELVELYGIPALWDVLDREPERLVEVKGITAKAAEEIGQEYRRVRGEREEMVQLRGWGLSDFQITRCRETWKKGVVAELQRDPYQLAEVVNGFGFKRADEVARRMGTATDAPARIRACIVHQLGEAEGAGHCYVPAGALVRISAEALDVRGNLVARELEALVADARVAREGARVYLPGTYTAEVRVAAQARRMLGAGPSANVGGEGRAAA